LGSLPEIRTGDARRQFAFERKDFDRESEPCTTAIRQPWAARFQPAGLLPAVEAAAHAPRIVRQSLVVPRRPVGHRRITGVLLQEEDR